MITRPIAHINLQALCENYTFLRSLVAPAECAAVVKNNAYGIGVVPVVKALQQVGCKTFWVAHAHEGAEIRPYLPTERIVVLQGPGEDSIALFTQYQLTPVINTLEQLKFWEAPFILHIDTGLNRYGLREHDVQLLLSQPHRLKNLQMIMSHLACADSYGHFMNEHQRKVFERYRALFPSVPASLSASDGAFLGSAFHYDMVRAGAALYGVNTAPYRENQMQAVLSIDAPILQIANLLKGEYLGYGATYRANSARRIAILSIGYGDGLPWQLSNKGKVYFKHDGQRYESRIVGRVSMDIICCDVTNIPDQVIHKLSTASILDADYTIDDMARDAGTIGYEILSRLGARYEFALIWQEKAFKMRHL